MKLGGKITLHILIEDETKEKAQKRIEDLAKKIEDLSAPIVEKISIDFIGKNTLKAIKRDTTYYESPAYGRLKHCFVNVNRLHTGDIILGYNLHEDTLIFYQKLGDTWISYNYSYPPEQKYYSDRIIQEQIKMSNEHSNIYTRFVTLGHFSQSDIEYIKEVVPYTREYKFIGLTHK